MAEIRLSKLTKEFNIGLQTLVDFLNGQGAGVEMNPNAKISDSYLPAIESKFGDEQKLKQDSEKVAIKLKEIIEKGSKKKAADEDEEPVKEIIIKSNSFAHQAPVQEAPKGENPAPKPEARPAEPLQAAQPEAPAPVKEPVSAAEPAAVSGEARVEGLKIVDKIDLSRFEKKPHKPKEEAPAAQPETKTEEPAAVEEKTIDIEEPMEETVVTEPAVKEPREIKIEVERLQGPKVVDKIDLSQFDRKKKNKKRERIAKGGSQKVDVTKVGSEAEDFKKDKNKKNGGKGDNSRKDNRQDRGNASQGGKGKKRDRFKPVMTEAEEEEMQKEIQKQIKETYARMNEGKSKNNFGAKHRREKRELASQKLQEEMEQQELEKRILKVTEFVTVNDLANLMNIPVTKVIGACMSLGLMVSINQRLDAETIVLVAEEFGYEVEFVTAELTEAIEQETDDEKDLVPRPPVITVMGHVDHGKTSLLDYIRKSNVIAGEAGGITQHIGAYNVVLPDGKRITFLDTPGHEAFTAMRARGAKMTDLAIIIIAADDAIMPQTVEAINHAQAAGVPMVFAINKIDKPGANPDKIREQLANMNLLVEEWGGKYQSQDISAKKGIGVNDLLEKVLLEAELLDLKANPNRRATGSIIESTLDKGRGYVATVLVANGTLKVGDIVLAGTNYGKIKAMFNERNQRIKEAGPSEPALILGLNGAPTAGDTFHVIETEQEAREIANKREQLQREQGLRAQKMLTLDEVGRRLALGDFHELNVIVKGDVDGSIEALSDSLIKLSTEQIQVNVIHKAVGQISESDVSLAAASDAIIIGFQVRPSQSARKLAEQDGVDIRLYSIIYDAIEDVKAAMEGMLAPKVKEEVTATIEVREVFKITKVGTVAGAWVREGKVKRTDKARLIRDGIVIFTGSINALKRFKDDVKEVPVNFECGISLTNYNDIKVGDIIETFQEVEVKQTL